MALEACRGNLVPREAVKRPQWEPVPKGLRPAFFFGDPGAKTQDTSQSLLQVLKSKFLCQMHFGDAYLQCYVILCFFNGCGKSSILF